MERRRVSGGGVGAAPPGAQIGAEPLLSHNAGVEGMIGTEPQIAVSSDCAAEVAAVPEPEILPANLPEASIAAVIEKPAEAAVIAPPDLPPSSEATPELAGASEDEAQAASSSSVTAAVMGAIGTTAAVWEAPD
jgi:hypothetical protein